MSRHIDAADDHSDDDDDDYSDDDRYIKCNYFLNHLHHQCFSV